MNVLFTPNDPRQKKEQQARRDENAAPNLDRLNHVVEKENEAHDFFGTALSNWKNIEPNEEKGQAQSFERFKPIEMYPSENIKKRLKQRERYSKMPYDNDGANNCTIGYGHLLHRGACTAEDYDKYKDGWSPAKAQETFERDVKEHEEIIKKHVKVDLSQGEFDALTHFVFNVGEPGFKKSTLLKKLNSGDYDGVPDEMRRWNKSTVNGTKKAIDGLIQRREDEVEIFNAK